MTNRTHTPQQSYEQPKRCYESHPALEVGGKLVYGGSCSRPIVLDADIYVGLDMSHRSIAKQYPWEEGESFLFYIQDMGVPKDLSHFTKLVDWMAEQILNDKKVHVGCIGGHGRTGTVLSALVKVMNGDKDAIEYVRKNYCKKAVESETQVEYLHKHFGINKVAPTKQEYWGGHDFSSTKTGRSSFASANHKEAITRAIAKSSPQESLSDVTLIATPTKNKISVWGSNVTLNNA